MSYRRVTYLEQIWYIIKYKFFHRRNKNVKGKEGL